MNIFDLILIIPIVYAAYNGYKKGFIIELASLAALVLGIYFGIHFSDIAAEFITDNFEKLSEEYVPIIAFIATFVIVVILVYFVGKILEKFINIILLGFLNKIAGLVFGIVKAAFLLSIVIFIINVFDESESIISPKWKNGSMLYGPIESLAPSILPKIDWESFNLKKEDTLNLLEDIY